MESKLIKEISGDYRTEGKAIFINNGKIVLTDGTIIACINMASQIDVEENGRHEQMLTRTIDVTDFESIVSYSLLNIDYVQSDQVSVIVEATEEALNSVDVQCNDKQLYVGMLPGAVDVSRNVFVHLTGPRLYKVDCFEASHVTLKGHLKSNSSVSLTSHQAGKITAGSVVCPNAVINVVESGSISMKSIQTITPMVINAKDAGKLVISESATSPTINIISKGISRVTVNGLRSDQIVVNSDGASVLSLDGDVKRGDFTSGGRSMINARNLKTEAAKASANEVSKIETSINGEVNLFASLTARIINHFKK